MTGSDTAPRTVVAGRTIVATTRAAVAVAILAAVAATLVDTLGRGPVNPFNFFGYFTVQSNLLLAAVLLWTAATGITGRTPGLAADLLRAFATTYITIVGLVYALLLAPLGEAGGVPVPWANTVLHTVSPVYGVVDWLVTRDRRALPFPKLWLAAVYPVVWLVVVLVRGATDGWVPYPFLDPATGYGAIAGVAAGIAVAVLTIAALVFWASRTGRQQPAVAE